MYIRKTEDLSSFIKALRKKRNIKVEDLADAIPITIQGLSNWLGCRKNVNWKIDSLISLSKILKFELKIIDGRVYVKENNMKKVEEYIEVSLKNNKVITYETFEELGDYSIVKLYTDCRYLQVNLNNCLDVPDNQNVYNTDYECVEDGVNINDIIDVYGLANNKTGEIIDNIKYQVQPEKLREVYLMNFAPILEVTDDGYEVVYISHEHNYKIAKTWAKVDIIKDDTKVLEYSNVKPKEDIDWWNGFAVMDVEGNSSKDFDFFTKNIFVLYERLNIMDQVKLRYFDFNNHEIKKGIYKYN